MITKLLKEELFRIQDLMNIKRTILNEEKAATSTVEGKCLNLKDYSKSFSAAQAATDLRAQEFINGILEYVKTTTPDLYSKWQSGTFLGISKVTLIGCASNRVTSDREKKYVQYSSTGGRAVLPTMDNNYVVKTYNKASYNTVLSGSGISDLNYPEYQVFFDDNLKYASDRVNNLWKWFPTIWRDRDWDTTFIYEVIKVKLNNQAKYIDFHNRHTRAKRDAELMRLTSRLIQLCQDDHYDMEYMDYHESNFNWLDITDEDGIPNKYKDSKRLEIDLISENFDDYFKKYPRQYKRVMSGEINRFDRPIRNDINRNKGN